MAIDQREALIAAVRAQVEKEKAAKAAKQRREQEALRLAGKKVAEEKADDKPKYKTLSAEELARIEEKKRRKRAEELGIDLDEFDAALEEEAKAEAAAKEAEKAASAAKAGAKDTKKKDSDSFDGVTGGKSGGVGLNLDIDGMAAGKVKILSDDKDEASDGTKVIAEGGTWQQSPASKTTKEQPDDVIKIVPNRTTPTNDVKSMYDIDDEDDALGAEISKLDTYKDDAGKQAEAFKEDEKKQAEAFKQEEKKQAEEDEAAKRAAQLEARRKEEARKREEARQKEEARRKKLEEAERQANEQERRIAEAEAKRRAAEAAKKKAAEEEARRIEEEKRKKAAEEAKARAKEEARARAEKEAREKAKAEATKLVNAAKAKVNEATGVFDELKKAELAAAKAATEAKKAADEEIKKTKDEATKRATAEAARKAEEEKAAKLEQEKEKKALEEKARKKAEEDALWKATEEALIKAVDDAKKGIDEAKKVTAEAQKGVEIAQKALNDAKKAENEAVKKVGDVAAKLENEKKKKADDDAKAAKEAEAVKAAEEAKKKSEADARAARLAEEQKKADEAAKMQKLAEEAAVKKAEEASKVQAETIKKAEEAKKALEEAKKAVISANKALEDADKITLDITQIADDTELPFAAYYLEKYTGSDLIAEEMVVAFNAASKAEGFGRNVAIMGDHGFGMTGIGEDFARSFYDMNVCKSKTIAKIKGQALNKVKLADAMEKLRGGCMVVENAGLITPERMKEILELTAPDKNDVITILTGEYDSILRLFDTVKEAKDAFTKHVNMRGMENEDMVIIAMGFIIQRGYQTDDSVSGILNSTIMAMETGNVDRMLKVVEDALLKCEAREKATGIDKKILSGVDFK